MAGSAEDINARFETPAPEGAKPDGEGASNTPAPNDDKTIIDKAADTNDNAAKDGGAALPDDVRKKLEEYEELRRYRDENPPKAADLTPEQKAAQEKEYQNNLHDYAFKNNLYTPEDLGKFEAIKGQEDKDLVYSNFKTNFKQINPDAAEDDIKEAFDQHYHTNSENEHLKKLGESRIQQDAGAYRTPYQSKLESAKEAYDGQRSMDAKVPDFDKFLKELVDAHSPENWVVFKGKDGDEEVPVNFQLSGDDKKIAFDSLRNPDNFRLFLSGDKQKATETLQKQAEALYRLTHNDKINNAIFQSGMSHGTKKGSTTGADNPFPLQTDKNATGHADISANEELRKSDDTMRDRRHLHG